VTSSWFFLSTLFTSTTFKDCKCSSV